MTFHALCVHWYSNDEKNSLIKQNFPAVFEEKNKLTFYEELDVLPRDIILLPAFSPPYSSSQSENKIIHCQQNWQSI